MIISASASVLVEPIAQELGIEHVVATELAEKDGRFTGEILFYCKGAAKAEALARIAQELNVDPDASFAYSDSATDIPMLEQVGHPVAVNPDRLLKKHAITHDWKIRTFKHPVPLFTAPSAREFGIGSAVVAGIAALVVGGILFARQQLRD